jgi:hypothetical protein
MAPSFNWIHPVRFAYSVSMSSVASMTGFAADERAGQASAPSQKRAGGERKAEALRRRRGRGISLAVVRVAAGGLTS